MGGDGVTKVVSRRLPREVEEEAEAATPPPFAGVGGERSDAGSRGARPEPPGEPPARDDSAAAA